MTTIVGCSKKKVETDEPVPAKDLYDSPFFDKRWRVATRDDDHVLILSALHGILEPDEPLLPYDKSMYDVPKDERRAMADEIDTSDWSDEVVVYAGKPYVEVIKMACGDEHEVVKPLSGRMGEQMQQLNEMLK